MPPIEDYALLGNLQSAALVARDGSVDWLCFPRFDSAACFAALLGAPDNGRWLLAPVAPAEKISRRYRTDTMILETVIETAEGSVRMIEFMPPGRRAELIRIVEGLSGRVEMHSELVIRFDFGRVLPWVQMIDGDLVAVAGPDALCYRAAVPVQGEEMRTVSRFRIAPGERIPFTLSWFASHEPRPEAADPERALDDTSEFWLGWAGGCQHQGAYHDEVHASLLVLKTLTFAPTGGVVAAPTTSLPESIGGSRNWDYRFCWLRDATLALLAMLRAGYHEEAQAWRDWLLRAVAGSAEDVQIMYGLAGERRLGEYELPWLAGYQSSQPVRVGNAASSQVQLDVYGEVLDALYQTRVHGAPADENVWSLTRMLLAWLEEGWRREDSGIWEVRGPTRHFTHSKVMAWLAFDRAVRFHEEFGEEGPVERWRALRDEIHSEVLDRSWCPSKGAFSQSYGSETLDASVLVMPLVGFLPADDPRLRSTVAALRRELSVDGLLRRYLPEDTEDGLDQDEGLFLACSFWLAAVLALQGELAEARELFERLLDLRNDVGLLAEEYDPFGQRQLGNFPQAFTHLALVEAALILDADQGLRHDGHRRRRPHRQVLRRRSGRWLG
jgi:GH15 family glucan-1,4-alpha-glucosidase